MQKIRDEGVRVITSRIHRELRYPSSAFGQLVGTLWSIPSFKSSPTRRRTESHTNSSEEAVVVYDLNCNPVSFDFGVFLFAAESYMTSKGRDDSHLIVVVHSETGWQQDEFKHYTPSEVSWRLNNILIPMVALWPHFSRFSLFSENDLSKFQWAGRTTFPPKYSDRCASRWSYKRALSTQWTTSMRGIRAPEQGLQIVADWARARSITRPLVSITLRDRVIDPIRNSRINEWARFASWLVGRGYCPVFIADADSPWVEHPDLKQFNFFYPGVWNLSLRASLYELAVINFFKSNGPGALALFNKKVKYISLYPIDEKSLYTSEATYQSLGIRPRHDNFTFSMPGQRILWSHESFQSLINEFMDIEPLISR